MATSKESTPKKTTKRKATTKVSATKAKSTAAKRTKLSSAIATPNATALDTSGTGYSPLINIGEYLPQNLFTASSNVPVVSKADFEQHKETLAGQMRSVDLLHDNLKLVLGLHQAEGIQIQDAIQQEKNRTLLGQLMEQEVISRTQAEKVQYRQLEHDEQLVLNQIKGKDIDLRNIELSTAGVRNQIADQKHQRTVMDFDGEQQLTQYHKQTWDIRLQTVQVELDQKTNELQQKREQLSAKTLQLAA